MLERDAIAETIRRSVPLAIETGMDSVVTTMCAEW